MNCTKIILFLMLITMEYIGTDARRRLNRNRKHKIKGPKKCVREAHLPADGQVFYMMHVDDTEWWYASYWHTVHDSPLSIHELVETRWPKWRWHDCGDGDVAIETLRYPGHYLWYTHSRGYFLRATVSPCSHSRNLFKPQTYREKSLFRSRDSDIRIEFCFTINKSSCYAGEAYTNVIYIPPVCEEELYTYFCNANTTAPSRVTLEYEYGISNSESTRKEIGWQIGSEMASGILGGIKFGISGSWAKQVGRSMRELTTVKYATEVPKGKMVKFVQKKVYYDKYSVQSKSITASEHELDWSVCNG